MRVHKTKYASMTNRELVARAEQHTELLAYYPLVIEIIERLKEAPEPIRTPPELLERQNTLL